MRYEYKLVDIPLEPREADAEAMLNAWGNDGWEAVFMGKVSFFDDTHHRVLFKRAKRRARKTGNHA